MLDIVRPRQPKTRRCTWPACPTKEAAKCFIKNCVYEITCSQCGRRYVGSIVRSLRERIKEHTESGRGSTIREHLLEGGEGTARVIVRVLTREENEGNSRLITRDTETIIIKKRQHELNTRTDSDMVDLTF